MTTLQAPFPTLDFATPRKLPRASSLKGRVVVVDVAFASEASGGGFEKVTRPFIDSLGARLAAWVDHHDHAQHAAYANDPRFLLRTKAEHGACPEMITPEVVARAGAIDTIVCHTDFDGLASAAKWIRKGVEPYPGSDDDARAIDTRIGTPGPIATRMDHAIRGAGRDDGLLGLIVRHLATGLADRSLWEPIDAAAARSEKLEVVARELAKNYEVLSAKHPIATARGNRAPTVAFLKLGSEHDRYDKTRLLLLGQERADIAALIDKDTLTLAAAFDSGINFLDLVGLSGGMPTLVSVHAKQWALVAEKLGVRSGP